MATLESLDALLQEELKDLYDAEKQLTKALPKMAKKAAAPELKGAFQEHLRQTEEQLERLERAFEELGMPARGKKCVGMQNLIKEGEDIIGEAKNAATRDAVMIAGAQKIEHYEIASYGTARTWASLLGNDEVASLLQETLTEEKEADELLTKIAEGDVNQSAAKGNGQAWMGAVRRRQIKNASGAARGQRAADRGRRSQARGKAGGNRARSR
jgi:ferritin-like metal-binding protein YciE